jgi:hypothetical protein
MLSGTCSRAAHHALAPSVLADRFQGFNDVLDHSWRPLRLGNPLIDRLQKRFISGQIVDVINEAEFLAGFLEC